MLFPKVSRVVALCSSQLHLRSLVPSLPVSLTRSCFLHSSLPTKKCTISGLSSANLELIQLLKTSPHLLVISDKLDHEEDKDSETAMDVEPIEESAKLFNKMITRMVSKQMGDSEKVKLSHLTDDTLADLNIVHTGFLELKPNNEERLQNSKLLGKDKLWSSDQLCRHLELLEELVPTKNERSTRLWIDAFFFRVSAMVLPGQQMVLGLESSILAEAVSPSITLVGFIDYTTFIANEREADTYLWKPSIPQAHKLAINFFVTKAKKDDPLAHMPQIVGEMFAIGKHLQKNVVRGVLTDGKKWSFIILHLNWDGQRQLRGGSYKFSKPVEYHIPKQGLLPTPGPEMIAGILFHWIQHRSEDLNEDDWLMETGIGLQGN